VLPELAGIGATPAARANFADVANRSAPAISPRAWPRLTALPGGKSSVLPVAELLDRYDKLPPPARYPLA
jgi:hypothetical protein